MNINKELTALENMSNENLTETIRNATVLLSQSLIQARKRNMECVFNTRTQAVEEFHNAFNAPVADKPTASIPEERYNLRHELMREENNEYLDAAKTGDIVEVADALGDMLYILCGTIIEHGMQHKIDEVFDEIQRSNMSKLGEDGKPIYREDGKVLKGANYFKPNIKKVLENRNNLSLDNINYELSRKYAGLATTEDPSMELELQFTKTSLVENGFTVLELVVQTIIDSVRSAKVYVSSVTTLNESSMSPRIVVKIHTV